MKIDLDSVVSRGLLATGLSVGSDGVYVSEGERPKDGERWHGHGYFERWLWLVLGITLVHQRVKLHRWRQVGTNKTCHSRPPEFLPSSGVSLAVVFVVLCSWIGSGKGLINRESPEPINGVDDSCASRRTKERWLHLFLPDSLDIQQALRRAVIERSEPRPVETLFEGGLSPPLGLERRRWKDPLAVASLFRAFAFLFIGALELDVTVPVLLTEARWRWSNAKSSSGF